MSEPLDSLITESRNPKTLSLHELSITEILSVMNQEDQQVPLAVAKEIPAIAEVVEVIVEKLKQGGRLFYIGAGTSGRLGVLDASEAPPTFGVDPGLIQAVIAGGAKAVFESIEGAEDKEDNGKYALQEKNFFSKDVLIGISASGRTPFVIGGLKYASAIGAYGIGLTANPKAELCNYTKICITPIVGPEVLTGSTRLKAGTAQKLILNMISTAAMIKLGKVYSNLMIELLPKSKKLTCRAQRIVSQITGCSEETAANLLNNTQWDVRKAVESFYEQNK